MTNKQPGPDAIMQLGLAFWGSKALLSAVELDLFTTLARGPLTGEMLTAKLGLQPRGTTDLLDALVSLGMLKRAGDQYANTPATDLYLDRAKPSYLGGMLEMANARLYPFWGSLTEGLRTGRPQNEAKTGGDFFAALYRDQARLRQFLHAMTGLSMGAAAAIAEKFPWDRYHTVIDVGAAEGCVPAQVALRHPHLTGGGFDLPAAGPALRGLRRLPRPHQPPALLPRRLLHRPAAPRRRARHGPHPARLEPAAKAHPAPPRPTRRCPRAGRSSSTTPSSTTTAPPTPSACS